MTYTVALDGGTLQRGFWLYVWEVTTPSGAKLLYVGRTGDSSSINAQSPFNRMGQHLGTTKTSSMLRNHLNLAISNPCIELWFLLHFVDQRIHGTPCRTEGGASGTRVRQASTKLRSRADGGQL